MSGHSRQPRSPIRRSSRDRSPLRGDRRSDERARPQIRWTRKDEDRCRQRIREEQLVNGGRSESYDRRTQRDRSRDEKNRRVDFNRSFNRSRAHVPRYRDSNNSWRSNYNRRDNSSDRLRGRDGERGVASSRRDNSSDRLRGRDGQRGVESAENMQIAIPMKEEPFDRRLDVSFPKESKPSLPPSGERFFFRYDDSQAPRRRDVAVTANNDQLAVVSANSPSPMSPTPLSSSSSIPSSFQSFLNTMSNQMGGQMRMHGAVFTPPPLFPPFGYPLTSSQPIICLFATFQNK